MRLSIHALLRELRVEGFRSLNGTRLRCEVPTAPDRSDHACRRAAVIFTIFGVVNRSSVYAPTENPAT